MTNTNDLLTRGVKEIVVKKNLEKALVSRKRLRVKLGLDPNIPDLHLGHAFNLRKLRAFQDLGHTAVLIIGDYTATIGDPSGKDKSREALDATITRANGKLFLEQIFKILDQSKTEVRSNSEWFSKMNFLEILDLASKISMEHILSHETFRQRISRHQPFFLHETFYPLMQGYDSVMVRADIELGALEQKFNLLTGRRLQRAFGQKEQDVIMTDYLLGLDGKEKMSKSLGNFISLRDSATEMFGKIMSIPGSAICHYFEMCTDMSESEIKEFSKQIKAGEGKAVKIKLAHQIIKIYHSAGKASQAEQEFEAVFSQNQIPDKIYEHSFGAKKISIIGALIESGMIKSRSEARRLIEQGGVKIDGEKVSDENTVVNLSRSKVLQVGKRRFLRITK